MHVALYTGAREIWTQKFVLVVFPVNKSLGGLERSAGRHAAAAEAPIMAAKLAAPEGQLAAKLSDVCPAAGSSRAVFAHSAAG